MKNIKINIKIEMLLIFSYFLISCNAKETTNINAVSALETDMALIPSGRFVVGNQNEEDSGLSFQVETIESYFIDKYEVTNRDFVTYLNEKNNSFYSEKFTNRDPDFKNELINDVWVVKDGYDYYPVVNVAYYEAEDYCEWRDSRLPTALEWEKAARGTEGLIFPWGNHWDVSLANSYEMGGYSGPFPVGSFPLGASPYGVLDMAGNVSEWYVGEFDIGRVRGGSWIDNKEGLRTFHTDYFWGYFNSYVGFRCVKSLSE